MENDKKYLLIGGVLLVIVVVFLFRRSSSNSAPVVIQSGATGDLSPTQERVALSTLNAGTFKDVLGYKLASEQNATGERLGSQQISSSQTLGLDANQTALALASGQNALDLAKSNIAQTLGLAQIGAGRDVGLAQASAQSLAAQNESANAYANLATLQNMQATQNRANATQSALSQLSGLLRALSGGKASGSGGSSGSGSNLPANTSAANVRRVPARTGIPTLDLALSKILDPQISVATPVFNPDYGTYNGGASDNFPWDLFAPSDWLTAPDLLTPDTSNIEIYPIDDPGYSNYDPNATDVQNYNDYGWAYDG